MHNKNIIEIGCGSGEFIKLLCELGNNKGIGFDPSYKEDRNKSDKVKFIKGRLSYQKLTSTAKAELPKVIAELVKSKEDRFVNFFNKAGPITVRLHSLELLSGIGKKHMWDIIDARDRKPFQSLKDLTERVNLLPDPVRVITERIMEELKGTSKYYLFIKPVRRQ